MHKDITIVLTAHKSKDLVLNYILKLYNYFNIVIVDNSNDKELEYEIFKNYPNIIFKFTDNRGYGAAINYASKFVKTKYFLVSNPDVEGIDEKNIIKFYEAANRLKNKFSIIGPIDLDHKPKRLKKKYNSDLIRMKQISGICMFFKKNNFDIVKGFDENIFLYFEDNDICNRIDKIEKNYQINTIKVHHKAGNSVISNNEIEKKEQNNLRTWHFIWSKFYYFKKIYGYIPALIYFIPTIIRIRVRILFYKIIHNDIKLTKYINRWSGLKSSILGKKSYKRI